MAYNKDIPQATDKISDSQAQILENYEQLSTYLSYNHLDINGTGNVGKHKFVTLTNKTPAPAVDPTEAAIYTDLGSVDTNPQLFWLQGTSNNIVNFTEFANNATDGWTRLPSGILVKWMTIPVVANPGPGVFFTVSTQLWPAGAGQPAFGSLPFQIQLSISYPGVLPTGVLSATVIAAATNKDQVGTITWNTLGSYPAFDINVLAFGLE